MEECKIVKSTCLYILHSEGQPGGRVRNCRYRYRRDVTQLFQCMDGRDGLHYGDIEDARQRFH